jgi:hypothetical protein
MKRTLALTVFGLVLAAWCMQWAELLLPNNGPFRIWVKIGPLYDAPIWVLVLGTPVICLLGAWPWWQRR